MEANSSYEDPVSTKKKKKTHLRELHKANIHERASMAKPLITNTKMQKKMELWL